MSLLSYEDARRYAGRIADRVSKRIMPPWPLDVTVGIQGLQEQPHAVER